MSSIPNAFTRLSAVQQNGHSAPGTLFAHRDFWVQIAQLSPASLRYILLTSFAQADCNKQEAV